MQLRATLRKHSCRATKSSLCIREYADCAGTTVYI